MKVVTLIFFSSIFLIGLFYLHKKKVNNSAKLPASVQGYIHREIIDKEFYDKAENNAYKSSLDSILRVDCNQKGISFSLFNGECVFYYNHGIEDDIDYSRYRYLGNLTMNYALFVIDRYETGNLFFINLVNGEKYDLLEMPYANENSTFLFTYSNNYDIEYLKNDIRLYEIKEDSLVELNEIPSFENWRPLEMFWVADDEIVVKFIPLDDSTDFKYRYEKWTIKK